MMTLGQRIQSFRKEAGLSQEALGEALHVSRQAVSKWEGDGGVPELDTLILMSRLFHVRLGTLLGLEEETPSPENAAEGGETPGTQLSPEAEQRLEALLQQYSQQARPAEKKPLSLRARIAAGAAACGLVLALILIPRAQNRALQDQLQAQLSTLQGRLSTLESSVSGQSSSLRDTVLSILETQDNPVSSMQATVRALDIGAKTISVALSAGLKTVSPDTQAQFLLKWIDGAGAEQEAQTDWSSAYPDARSSILLPLGDASGGLQMCLRLKLADGTLQQSPWDYAGVDLALSGYVPTLGNSLYSLASISAQNGNTTVFSPADNTLQLQLFLPLDKQWPVSARYTVTLDDAVLYDGDLTIEPAMDYQLAMLSFPEDQPLAIRLEKDHTLQFNLSVIDTLGLEYSYGETVRFDGKDLIFPEIAESGAPAHAFS